MAEELAAIHAALSRDEAREAPADLVALVQRWQTAAMRFGEDLAAARYEAKVANEAKALADDEYRIVCEQRDAARAALADLVRRCDGDEGVRADGSNIDTAWQHAVLAGSAPTPGKRRVGPCAAHGIVACAPCMLDELSARMGP